MQRVMRACIFGGISLCITTSEEVPCMYVYMTTPRSGTSRHKACTCIVEDTVPEPCFRSCLGHASWKRDADREIERGNICFESHRRYIRILEPRLGLWKATRTTQISTHRSNLRSSQWLHRVFLGGCDYGVFLGSSALPPWCSRYEVRRGT